MARAAFAAGGIHTLGAVIAFPHIVAAAACRCLIGLTKPIRRAVVQATQRPAVGPDPA